MKNLHCNADRPTKETNLNKQKGMKLNITNKQDRK